MSIKSDMKRDFRNLLKDVNKQVQRNWKLEYMNHSIEVGMSLKEDVLTINGKVADQRTRKSLLSYLVPFSKLSATIVLEDGTKQKVSVKLGGFTRLKCVVKVDNKILLVDSQKLEFLPWEHKEKIVPHIERQVRIHHKVLDDSLPDDKYMYEEDEPRVAAGLADYLEEEMPTLFYTKKLLKLFEEQTRHPSVSTRKATYEEITFGQIASYGHEFIERFQQASLDESAVQQEALWLLEHAAHREVVKFSLTVLGFTNCERHNDLIMTLGLHEEFTQYSVFALKNGVSGANEKIWRLAQSLNGWGKISAVENLEGTTAEIKEWLLTKGYQNEIMHDYLALPCAIKGELDHALYEEVISKEIYDGAGGLIMGLLSEERTQELDDYPYAGVVLTRFVHHANTHCHTLEDFYPIMLIHQYIQVEEEVWEDRLKEQWKPHEYATIVKNIQPFIDDSKWSRLAVEALQDDHHSVALEVARFYQLDVTPALFNLLKKDPKNSHLYFEIMQTRDSKQIQSLCLFAEDHLELENSSDEDVNSLINILQSLDGHEGVGIPLITAALKSDDAYLQYQALYVLNEWSATTWQHPQILESIKHLSVSAEDKEDRKLAKELLKRQQS